MEPRRPHALDAGLFLLVVALPLAFFPMSIQPFSDLKLVVLLLGTLLVWLSGVGGARRLAPAAAAWALVSIVAAAAGVDPAGSVVGPWEATGLLLLLACAVLVVVGPALPGRAVEHMRGWLVWVAVAVAVVAVLWRLVPQTIGLLVEDLGFLGSTLGNPVFAAALLAAAIPAAVAGRHRPRLLAVVMVALGSAFAVNGERSSLVLPLLALAACWWPLRADRRRIGLAGLALAGTMLVWALVAPGLPSGYDGLRSTGGQFQTLEGEQQRLAVWTANARAATERPALGWGPGLGWSAYLASASAEELETAGRGWTDAHALPLQLLVTTGLLGFLALGLLAWQVARGSVDPPPENRWAAASALVLAVFALYEPLNLVVTPLLFLLAGIAKAGHGDVAPVASRPIRAVVASGLAIAVALAGLSLTASALEQWGRTHYAEWAVRASLRVQPWRLSAAQRLSIELALDGRAGDVDAALEARRVIVDAVAEHPWDPMVRLTAIDVELLLRDPDGAEPWRRAHLERFPNDDLEPESGATAIAGA